MRRILGRFDAVFSILVELLERNRARGVMCEKIDEQLHNAIPFDDGGMVQAHCINLQNVSPDIVLFNPLFEFLFGSLHLSKEIGIISGCPWKITTSEEIEDTSLNATNLDDKVGDGQP